jgi:hypothetical protein
MGYGTGGGPSSGGAATPGRPMYSPSNGAASPSRPPAGQGKSTSPTYSDDEE